MPGRSLYDMVGADADASAREIGLPTAAPRGIGAPDLGGSDAAFRQVSAAYEVLRDPDRRARYDRRLAAKAAARPRQAASAGTAQPSPAPGRPTRPGRSALRPVASRPTRDNSRLQRNYLVTMTTTTCLLLFVLSGAVVRAYSVPAAVAMAVVAMVLLPFAALMANRKRSRLTGTRGRSIRVTYTTLTPRT